MLNSNTKSENSTRYRILKYLLLNRTNRATCCSVEKIAEALGLSQNAIRQHLTILLGEELVIQAVRKSKTGRPAKLYSLHSNAFELFPKEYPDFSTKLIGEVKKRYGQLETLKILENVGKSIIAGTGDSIRSDLANNSKSVSLNQKLELIKNFYQRYGKFPKLVEEKDSFVLKNYNCLLFDMAKNDPLICQVDESILSELLGQKAVKEQCIRDGDPCCLYRIKKGTPKK